MIGYPREQEDAILPGRDYPLFFARNGVLFLFFDQAWLVKMAEYWPHTFFAYYVSIHKHAKKKELAQYSAILTEQAWSITHPALVHVRK